jgi:hypothetical protein
MTHDPSVADLRATLATARAVLAADPGAAHDAAATGSCAACTVIASIQFGYTLAVELAGAGFVTGPLRDRLQAAIDTAQAELDAGLN